MSCNPFRQYPFEAHSIKGVFFPKIDELKFNATINIQFDP